jgi:capsular exopolysaccharide synthesis family protein
MSQEPALYASPLPPDELQAIPVEFSSSANQRAAENPLRIVLRHRLACSLVALAVIVLGTVLLASLTPQYFANTVMIVTSRQPDLAATDQVAPVVHSASSTRDSDVEPEKQLMVSRDALLKVAREVDLGKDIRIPEGILDKFIGAALHLHAYWDELLGAISESPQDRPNPAIRPNPEEKLVEALRKRLRVEPIGKSTTVDIGFSASDPVVAAAVANAVAETYIENRLAARREDAERAAKYLRTRSQELLAEVTASEKAVEGFRESSVLRDGRDIEQLRAEMEKTNTQLAAVRIEKAIAATKLEAVEARVKQVGIVGALESGESKLNDGLRQRATEAKARLVGSLSELAERHPAAQRAQKEYNVAQAEVIYEAQARLSRLRAGVTMADQQVRLLQNSLQAFRSDYDHLSATLIAMRGLERHATAARSVYEALLGKVKLAEQVGFNEAESWILSRAKPPTSPSSPNPMSFFGATLFAAFAAAFAVALLLERRASRTVLSAEHILDRGYRALGIVPELARGRLTLPRALTASQERSTTPFTESIGGIFTSVMHLARPDQSSLVLLVTSAMPFEGKSTTITALAGKMASAGNRVLMIDCDLHGPRLHRAFGFTNSRGLSDCIQSPVDLNSIVKVDTQTGISVVTAGRGQVDPQKVLSSQKLCKAIEQWRSVYDFILIDAPPVLPISDVRILLPLTDYCLFVTRWRKTRWTTAMHGLRLLRESGARLAGVVLSSVDIRAYSAYGFADSEIYGSAYERYAAFNRS